MRILRWAFFNGIFCAVAYLAMFEDSKGAGNVLIFWTWFSFLVTTRFFTKEVQTALKKTPISIPAAVDGTFDVLITLVLLWQGWIVTAVVYFLHFLLLQSARAKAEEEKENEKHNA